MTVVKRPLHTYTNEFKNQIVQLYKNRKHKCEILREYELSFSLLNKWMRQANTTSSFKEKDNRPPEDKVLIQIRIRNKQLEMKNEILKQEKLSFEQK